ncbi:SpaA isopeptide-forming pilin-related protein [Lapidilactobacillus wuchangensis]|uniref:SpaA isopeptide-forming pilin-related protein n=1 Tax=Lapidilactobacillus wuchangensis TaxID=2486001 RepID=UPI000F78F927|nr:SpaA isopeptide-forming pilin-related protein [Lapidilactobacillus wuchangensis]
MKIYKKGSNSIFVVLMSLAITILAIWSFGGQTAKAAEVQVNGLTASDAKIYDQDGNEVTNNQQLDLYTGYKVSYNWSIPDGVQIVNGDTTTFTIPDNVEVKTTTTFDILDEYGIKLGEATVTAGSQTGTIVFNNYFTEATADRHGTLFFYANGTHNNNTGNENWVINKVGTVVSRAENARVIRWNVALNIAGKNLKDVTITDTLGPGQTYIPGSMIVNRLQNGVYIGSITPDVTVEGNVMTIKVGDVNDYLDIYYNTATTNNQNTYSNNATITVNGQTHTVNANVDFGGGGTGTGTNGTAILEKTSTTSKAPIAGAYYKVVDANGKTVQENLTTNEKGQITVNDLMPGQYYFVETQAPAGYLLDATPIPFTIVAGVTDPVMVSATNQPISLISIMVKKLWENLPADLKTPAITAVLYQNGVATNQTLTLNAENNYQASFENLPATDSLGNKITYTVAEAEVPAGYTNVTTGPQTPDKDGLVTLVNRYQEKEKPTPPTKPTKPVTKPKEPAPTKPVTSKPMTPKPVTKPSTSNTTAKKPTTSATTLPQTNEKDAHGVWTAMGLLVLFGLGGLWIKKRETK